MPSYEIRFHGRGGQGAKSAAQFLVEVALLEGKYIQAFPEYGPERSGAPVSAFSRISDGPIETHQPILSPDYIVVIDETLISEKSVLSGASSETTLLVNSKQDINTLKNETGFQGKIYAIDASSPAIKYLGKNQANTAMLSALVKITGMVSMENVKKIVYDAYAKKSEKIAQANIMIIEAIESTQTIKGD